MNLCVDITLLFELRKEIQMGILSFGQLVVILLQVFVIMLVLFRSVFLINIIFILDCTFRFIRKQKRDPVRKLHSDADLKKEKESGGILLKFY